MRLHSVFFLRITRGHHGDLGHEVRRTIQILFRYKVAWMVDRDVFFKESQAMKRLPCLFSLLVLSTSVVMAVTCYAQEQEAVTVPQAIDERASEVPGASRLKGALEPGGQPMGKTAPLNGDRSSGPTAQNQSSKADSVRITKEIRQQIIERGDLSTAAKNVKIITDDQGAVTLRGPVKTANEKQQLEQIARSNAHGGQVTNQLVVKGEQVSEGAAHG